MTELPLIAAEKAEPTLETALRSVAAAQMPARFYQLLHFAIPWGAQLWVWGWHRSAGWMFALGCFAAWALCEKRRQSPAPNGRHAKLTTVIRLLAAVGGGLITVVLLFDAFVQLLKVLFNCPGCAG